MILLLHQIILYVLDKIRDEKLPYDINRKAANISVLSLGKIDRDEYLTGEEKLPSNQRSNDKTS